MGELAGIEIESLLFSFEIARKSHPETVTTQLKIQQIAGLARCHQCAQNVPADFFVATCPHCGQSGLELVTGRELKVRSINVD